ncbi:MAG: acyl carrier protein [Synergistaceae bacterium]|nr:acyl carrier protein [Synergistaceae bacterium]
MTDKEKIALLAETIEADEEALKPEALLADIEQYDSMGKLSIIVMMEDEFGVKLDSDTVKSFVKVGDILALMKKDA